MHLADAQMTVNVTWNATWPTYWPSTRRQALLADAEAAGPPASTVCVIHHTPIASHGPGPSLLLLPILFLASVTVSLCPLH